MDYDQVEKFMNELDMLFNDFRYYIMDEANTEYCDNLHSQEKVIAGLQSLQGMFNKKIGMEVSAYRVDLKEKRKTHPEFEPFTVGKNIGDN